MVMAEIVYVLLNLIIIVVNLTIFLFVLYNALMVNLILESNVMMVIYQMEMVDLKTVLSNLDTYERTLLIKRVFVIQYAETVFKIFIHLFSKNETMETIWIMMDVALHER